jgi:hypothetical protein
MAAYELIEDRNAVYSETQAISMIVENCWNGGVVLGPMTAVKPFRGYRCEGKANAQRQSNSRGQS